MVLSTFAEEPDEPRVLAPKKIMADAFAEALTQAGVIRADENIRRIVIDAQAGHVVMIHIERFGDTRLLDVVRTLTGIEIRELPAEPTEAVPDP